MPPRKTNSSSGGARASSSATPAAPALGAVEASPQPPAQHGPSDRDSAASVSLADMFAPSQQEPLENTEDSDDSAGENEEPLQDSLLAMLDPSQEPGSPFALWFQKFFDSSSSLRARILSGHAANPQLMPAWIALLFYAWDASDVPRASAEFGITLLSLLGHTVSVTFLQPFLLFVPRSFSAQANLTAMPPSQTPRAFDMEISDSVFNTLRKEIKHGNLPGDWPFLVNEAFFAVVGERVVALTDLNNISPTALLIHLGAHEDFVKFLPPDIRTKLMTQAATSQGDLRSIMADGAGRVSDIDLMLSRLAPLEPLLAAQHLTREQATHLNHLVSLISPSLTPATQPSHELAFYTREMDNLCKCICRFCLKLAQVLVDLGVSHASKYLAVADHVCHSYQHSRLGVLTRRGSSQVLDPLTACLLRAHSHCAVLPAFQAVVSLNELLGESPSKEKQQLLVDALAFSFDLTRPLDFEIQRLLDVRSKTLVCLGASKYFPGTHPALGLPQIIDMIDNSLSGRRLTKSTDQLALNSFRASLLDCSTFEHLLDLVRSHSSEHVLQGNPGDAIIASVHAASSSILAVSERAGDRQGKGGGSRSGKGAKASGAPVSRDAPSGDSSTTSRGKIPEATLKIFQSTGKAVVALLRKYKLTVDDYVCSLSLQGHIVHAWLRASADYDARAVKVPSEVFNALEADDKEKFRVLMRAGSEQWGRQYFVASVLGQQVQRVHHTSRPPQAHSASHSALTPASRTAQVHSASSKPKAGRSAAAAPNVARSQVSSSASSSATPLVQTQQSSMDPASTALLERLDRTLSLLSAAHVSPQPLPPPHQFFPLSPNYQQQHGQLLHARGDGVLGAMSSSSRVDGCFTGHPGHSGSYPGMHHGNMPFWPSQHQFLPSPHMQLSSSDGTNAESSQSGN
jgi:hypothetical protein